MTLGLAQALAEYAAIIAHDAAIFLANVAGRTVQFVSTPRGIVIASMVAVFLAFSLMWRRPPRI
jgi:hypothetical protein